MSVLDTVGVPEVSKHLFLWRGLCCNRSQQLWPRDQIQSITSFCMDLLEHGHNHLITCCLRWLSCYQSWVIKQRLYHPQSWRIYCLALYSKVSWLPGHTIERDCDHAFTPPFFLLLFNTSPHSALPFLLFFLLLLFEWPKSLLSSDSFTILSCSLSVISHLHYSLCSSF